MQLERYPLRFIRNREVFEFESTGPKGVIKKRVQFELVDPEQAIYNLAFGDIDLETNEISDTAVSNNGDTGKVLQTVVGAADPFFQRYPYVLLYIAGSTPGRIRLYQMGINKHLEVADAEYFILGETNDDWEAFKRDTAYKAFLVRKRN